MDLGLQFPFHWGFKSREDGRVVVPIELRRCEVNHRIMAVSMGRFMWRFPWVVLCGGFYGSFYVMDCNLI